MGFISFDVLAIPQGVSESFIADKMGPEDPVAYERLIRDSANLPEHDLLGKVDAQTAKPSWPAAGIRPAPASNENQALVALQSAAKRYEDSHHRGTVPTAIIQREAAAYAEAIGHFDDTVAAMWKLPSFSSGPGKAGAETKTNPYALAAWIVGRPKNMTGSVDDLMHTRILLLEARANASVDVFQRLRGFALPERPVNPNKLTPSFNSSSTRSKAERTIELTAGSVQANTNAKYQQGLNLLASSLNKIGDRISQNAWQVPHLLNQVDALVSALLNVGQDVYANKADTNPRLQILKTASEVLTAELDATEPFKLKRAAHPDGPGNRPTQPSAAEIKEVLDPYVRPVKEAPRPFTPPAGDIPQPVVKQRKDIIMPLQ